MRALAPDAAPFAKALPWTVSAHAPYFVILAFMIGYAIWLGVRKE